MTITFVQLVNQVTRCPASANEYRGGFLLNGEYIFVAGRVESDLRFAKRRVSRPGGTTTLESDCWGICFGVACEGKEGLRLRNGRVGTVAGDFVSRNFR